MIAISASGFKALMECPTKWDLRQRWTNPASGPELTFGTRYHRGVEILETWRISGADMNDALRAALLECVFQPWSPELQSPVHNPSTLARALVWYLEEGQPGTGLVDREGKPLLEVPFRVNITPNVAIVGYIDRLVNINGENWIEDHKTTKRSVGADFGKQYDSDAQGFIYTLAGQTLFPSLDLKGVSWNVAALGQSFVRFHRFPKEYRPELVDEFREQAAWAVERAGLDKATGRLPMNYTACRFCEFRGVCSKLPENRAGILERDFKPRDPTSVEGFYAPEI